MVSIDGVTAKVEGATAWEQADIDEEERHREEEKELDDLMGGIWDCESEFRLRANKNNGKDYISGTGDSVVVTIMDIQSSGPMTLRQPVAGLGAESQLVSTDGCVHNVHPDRSGRFLAVDIVSQPTMRGETHPLLKGMDKMLDFKEGRMLLDGTKYKVGDKEISGQVERVERNLGKAKLEKVLAEYRFTLSRTAKLATGEPVPPKPEAPPPEPLQSPPAPAAV